MIGRRLITPYTSKEGMPVNSIYVLEHLPVKKEVYISLKLENDKLKILYSKHGGVPIREQREKYLDDLKHVYVDILEGPELDDLCNIAENLGLWHIKSHLIYLIMHLYECFVERDCSLIEINPLVLNKQNKLIAVGSQIRIDDDAIFRQAELEGEIDRTQFTYSERIA